MEQSVQPGIPAVVVLDSAEYVLAQGVVVQVNDCIFNLFRKKFRFRLFTLVYDMISSSSLIL